MKSYLTVSINLLSSFVQSRQLPLTVTDAQSNATITLKTKSSAFIFVVVVYTVNM